jgi:ATP-dependent RNA helicase DDX46/PRP5
MEGPIALILAPTRELAVQIHRECKPYLRTLQLRAACLTGGDPIAEQIGQLRNGAEIAVCTPGRLVECLLANSGRVTNLARVTYVVIDEADRMFDMGFGSQVSAVLDNIRPDRQIVFFSATHPKHMDTHINRVLVKPIEITVGGRSVVASQITQIVEIREPKTKFHRLLQLLGELFQEDDAARALIFVEKQESADHLLRQLFEKNHPCGSIHGGRDQQERSETIQDFKSGALPTLIATSVAARGLDVPQLTLVVNYDPPNHIEDYVHRCGRTGRAGRTGTAITFVSPEQGSVAHYLVRALTDSKQTIPEDVAALAKSFDERLKAGTAQVFGGFGGRGIARLTAEHRKERAAERKKYRTEDDGSDEEEDEEKKKQMKAIESAIAKATSAVRESDAPSQVPAGGNTPAQQTNTTPPASKAGLAKPSDPAMSTALAEHLDNAMKVEKREIPAPTAASDARAKAQAVANSINARLQSTDAPEGQLNLSENELTNETDQSRPTIPTENRGLDAGAFHAILEINDFPQQARWAVTNRSNVSKILQQHTVSITNKGTFYAAGTQPGPGDQPKLYILVEGDTQVVVSDAMQELVRLLKEGHAVALEAAASASVGGRYKVV